ncbi:MAG: DUF6898 family protein [Rhodospirillaceae bacterium]
MEKSQEPSLAELEQMARGREVLYEIRPMGNVVRIAAIDGVTGLEAVVVGARMLSMFSMKANARRKLLRLLHRHGQIGARIDPWAGL